MAVYGSHEYGVPFMILSKQSIQTTRTPHAFRMFTWIAVLSMPFLAWMAAILVPAALRGKLDFISYYSAGHIVLSHPGSLYDRSLECQVAQIATGGQDCSPFIHPSYEALFFSPLSILPYRAAYILFGIGNLLVLALIWRALKPSWELMAFAPLAMTIVFGQDSILFLGIITAVFATLRKGKLEIAGMLLGIGLFRFQNVLPLVALLAIWREWRFLRGFVLSAILVALLSILLVHPREYLSVLWSLTFQATAEYTQRVKQMVNLRALLSEVLPPPWLLSVLTTASIGVLGLIAWVGSHRQLYQRFSLALIGTSLVSFHFYPHDLSLLLIPLSLQVRNISGFNQTVVTLVMLGAMLPVFNDRAYLTCVPVLVLLIYKLWDLRRLEITNPASMVSI
jgi:hypothetical protein